MYVLFEIIEKLGKFYMNDMTRVFTEVEPVGLDYYVDCSQYPEMFFNDAEHAGFKDSYYCPHWWGRPQWEFLPDAYKAGRRCFRKFDPTEEEFFLRVQRRQNIEDELRVVLPESTEFKLCRTLIERLFSILIDNGLASEIPADLVEWGNSVKDCTSVHPKDPQDIQVLAHSEKVIKMGVDEETVVDGRKAVDYTNDYVRELVKQKQRGGDHKYTKPDIAIQRSERLRALREKKDAESSPPQRQ